jgi:hypothetical protein
VYLALFTIDFEMSKIQRPFYLFLVAVVLVNTLVWLDSFDRYLSSRYHIALSAALPEQAFVLSRQVQAIITHTQRFGAAKLAQLLVPPQRDAEPATQKLNAKLSAAPATTQTNEGISAQAHTAPAVPVVAAAPVVTSVPVPASAPVSASVPASVPALALAPVLASVPASVSVPTATPAVPPAAITTIPPAPAAAPIPTTPAVVAPTSAVAPTPAAVNATTSSVPSTAAASTAATSSKVAGASADVATATITFPKVLFAGDSMMQGVAPLVINQLRKENSKGVFVDLSAQSTGLTVRRYFDWPTKIKEETLARGFELVAVFLGPNDPWDIYEGAKRYAFGTPEWEEKYRDRVIEVMQFAQERQVHVIWIGLPNMKEERVKRGAIVQNKIFKEQAGQFNFDYLSTEDFLGALDEPFKKFVEEPGKGQVMIRADDGIHFTQAGLRLISARLYELIKKQAKP